MNPKLSIPLDEDDLACSLWKKCSREYTLALYTPFVVCLAAGNLEWKTYQYYLFQDICYGKSCIELAEKAATITNDEDAKDVFNRYKKGWEKELERLKGFIEPGIEYPINPATESYKQHLLDTVSGTIQGQIIEGPKVGVFTLGAMMPCWRLYASLGQKLVTSLGGEVDNNNPYKDWIDSNAKDSLEEKTRKVESLLNKLCEPLVGAELEIVEKLYRESMIREIEFFRAPPTLDQPTVLPLKKVAERANVRLLLLSDIAPTSSLLESSPILTDIKIVTASSNEADLGKYCEEDYKECIENIMSSQKVDQFHYDTVQKGLEPFSVLKGRDPSEVQTTGDFNWILESPADKIQAYDDILKKYNGGLTVYIGSSIGDLLCLLRANIGIMVESSSSLQRVGSHLGVSFLPLFSSLLKKQKAIARGDELNWKESGVIYSVASWAEIDAFISGWEN